MEFLKKRIRGKTGIGLENHKFGINDDLRHFPAQREHLALLGERFR